MRALPNFDFCHSSCLRHAERRIHIRTLIKRNLFVIRTVLSVTRSALLIWSSDMRRLRVFNVAQISSTVSARWQPVSVTQDLEHFTSWCVGELELTIESSKLGETRAIGSAPCKRTPQSVIAARCTDGQREPVRQSVGRYL